MLVCNVRGSVGEFRIVVFQKLHGHFGTGDHHDGASAQAEEHEVTVFVRQSLEQKLRGTNVGEEGKAAHEGEARGTWGQGQGAMAMATQVAEEEEPS